MTSTTILPAKAGDESLADDSLEHASSHHHSSDDFHRDNSKKSVFQWFHPEDSVEERKLILKLDFLILSFACAGFWTLYIDRGIITNAFVSGMKQDLNMFGNEFIQLNAIFTIGYAISIIPLTVLNARFPPQVIIPICMAVWGTFTALAARANSFSELAGYRFLVGFAEGAFFPSINYVLGCWYRPDEIARRSGLFFIAGSIGSLSQNFLAARIFQNLNGSLGLAGWKWMFIIGGAVTFPVAIFGLITFPGTPQTARPWLLTEDELLLSKARMDAVGRRPPRSIDFSLSTIKRFFGRWHFYVLVIWSIVFQQGYLVISSGAWAMWIASNKQYSTVDVNNLTAVTPCVGLVFIVLYAWTADHFGAKARLPLFTFACTVMGLGHLAFVIYDVSPFAYKWYGVAVGQAENSMVPIMYSWANLICRDDAEERAFVLGSMLAFAMAFNSWTPLVLWPTTESPRFFKGFLAGLIAQPLAIIGAVVVYYLHNREQRRKTKA